MYSDKFISDIKYFISNRNIFNFNGRGRNLFNQKVEIFRSKARIDDFELIDTMAWSTFRDRFANICSSQGLRNDISFPIPGDIFDYKFNLLNEQLVIHDKKGVSGIDAYYSIDTNGIVKPTKHPELLTRLLITKASLNMQIKEWAQGRADGTLPLIEFSKRQLNILYPNHEIDEDCKTLVWVNNEPVYHRDIETQYNLPEWVINAVEAQKSKYYN